MWGRRAAALAAAGALSLGIAACGDDNGEGESDDPSTAVVEILSSNEPEVCDRLTEDFIEQITGQTGEEGRSACEDVVTSGDPPANIEVSEVSEEGDTASGTATSDEGSVNFGMVREEDEWKLDSLGIAEGPDSSENGGGGGEGGGSGSGNRNNSE